MGKRLSVLGGIAVVALVLGRQPGCGIIRREPDDPSDCRVHLV